MKSEILKMLRESGAYVSGQELCETFGVSRTAIWKVINQLKDEGYQIEAVRNKGYHLCGGPDVLSGDEIASYLRTDWAGQNLVYYDETDSTNTQAKTLAEYGGAHGTLVVADKQCAGKGRRGRSWSSPSGSSIYMSLLLKPDMNPNKASMLTLVMAQSVAEAIREQEGLDAKIKWPNDIVIGGRKVCGILTEMSAEVDYIHYVVIGVGINVNMEEFPEEIRATATSLRIEQGHEVKRAELIACVMRRFEEHYQLFIKTGDLSGMRDVYNALLVNRDREVCVLEPQNEYRAHAIGINENGELLVRREDGEVTAIYAGEVSVRGIYGYV